jgi:flagellar M-ring protein FliF
MDQLRKLWSRFNPRQRLSLAAVTILVLVALFTLLRWNRERDFKPLYSGLSAEDAGAIVTKLKENATEYRLAESNSSVLVPSERVAELRLEMANAGIPKTGRIGYELFDKTNLGTTDFAEQVNYHRAIEGELERSILLLAEVEQSRVHITFPKDSVFTEDRQPAKASVMVKLRPAARLSGQNAAAMTQLVASAVEGLSPEGVSVLDMQGNLLIRPKKPGDGSQPSEDLLDFKTKLEHDTLLKIESVLGPLLGAEKFRASVDFDCDQTSGEQSEETFDPNKSVMTTSQRSEEGSVKAESSGVPGTSSNLPRPTPRPSPVGGGVARRTESINYETSRLVRKLKMPQGVVRRMSVSVLVDQGLRWQLTGKGTAAHFERIVDPPSPDRMKVIRDVVAAAAGFNASRGDQLIVETLPFEATLKAEPPPVPIARPINPQPAKPKLPIPLPYAAAGVGIVLLLLVAGVFHIRSQNRAKVRLAAMQKQLAADSSTSPAEKSGQGELSTMDNEPATLEGASSERDRQKKRAELRESFNLPPLLTSKTEILTKQLTEEAEKDPVALAQIVRSWLNEGTLKR